MAQDSPWASDPLKSILAALGVGCEVLIAMTVAERATFWTKYQYGIEVAALAEDAVCESSEALKMPESLKALRSKVDALLNAQLPDDYKPLDVDITITGGDGEVSNLQEASNKVDDIIEDITGRRPEGDASVLKALDAEGNELVSSPTTDAPKASTSVPGVTYKPYSYEPPKRSELEESYVGLVNQGGTCYLNATVQALFHIPRFREIIYNIRVSETAASEFANITTALQNLFLALQTKKPSISTVELTQSFGWNPNDAHEQHDAHEMIQRLLEAFEMITNGTPAKDELHQLFYGKALNYVRCLDTDYVSRNPAEFFDLELLTLNKASMEESLKAKVSPEKLDGEYKREYDDGREPTRHPAEMGSVFLSLPPVLFVHPSRVDFCMQTFQRKMVDTEWTFEKKLNFSRYVAKDPESGVEVISDGSDNATEDPNLDYELLSVIMHQGTPFAGHYIAYTRFGDKWLKFNDSTVSEVTEASVLADGYSTPSTSKDYWGSTMSRPAYTRASVLVYIRSALREKLVFPITDEMLPSALHDNLKLKAEREEQLKKEAEIKARRVGIRYIVADHKGAYLSALGALSGREGPTDRAEMDKDVVGDELLAGLAAAAKLSVFDIQSVWAYPEYYWPNTAYSAPKQLVGSEKAGEVAKGWVVIQPKPVAAAPSPVEDTDAPMHKEDTSEGVGMGDKAGTSTDYTSILDAPAENAAPKPTAKYVYSTAPAVIPLCVLKRGGLEYLGIVNSTQEVVDTLTAISGEVFTDELLKQALASKRERTRPIKTHKYAASPNDSLYGEGAGGAETKAEEEKEVAPVLDDEADIAAMTVDEKYSFCCIDKNSTKNVLLRSITSGTILIAYPSPLATNVVANAFDKLCNPLNITVYQLDDALTPEELCELVICPSYTYSQLQEVVYEAMMGGSVPLLAPIRRMPAGPEQIGFRCHDDKTDRPHKTMALTNKYNYDAHTAQSILSNRTSFMITKLYVEVLPPVISIPELDGHGRVCDIPLHLGYFYQRHFYMKEGRDIPLSEVFRVVMAQQLDSLPAEFRERVEPRWLKSREEFVANRDAVKENPRIDLVCKQPTFDPVFRLVRMAYNGTSTSAEYYDWSENVTLDNYYDYVVDLLPEDITTVNWVKYVAVEAQIKPAFIDIDTTETTTEVTPIMSREATSADGVTVSDITTPVERKEGEDVRAEVTISADGEAETPAVEPEATSMQPDAVTTGTTTETATDTSAQPSDKEKEAPMLLLEGPKAPTPSNIGAGNQSRRTGAPTPSIPGEDLVSWYNLFHGDRKYTDAIYGHVTSVVLPLDPCLTGADLLELILKQIGVHPEEERFPDVGGKADADTTSAAASALSSPASTTATAKALDVYQTAKKTWKLVFKGNTVKVLEPNVPYSKIADDVGTVDYIMLDHPQSTKARVIPRNQRAEQAIRIGIITSETDKMKAKHEEGRK